MLTFTDRQLASFTAPDDTKAVQHIRNAVIRKHARAVARMSDAELSDAITIGVQRARAYSLRQIDSLMVFVLLMLEVAPGFDRETSIAAHLAAAIGHDADQAALTLSTVITPDAWRIAATFTDPSEWTRTTRAEP